MTHLPEAPEAVQEHPVVLFDGVCNLCNGWVNFVIDRDPRGVFRFASLQSETARRLLESLGKHVPSGDPDSIVLVEGARVYEASTAVLRIARRLSGPWFVLGVLLSCPRAIRDAVYRFIAARRYRWFGRTEACRIPTPENRSRFLE